MNAIAYSQEQQELILDCGRNMTPPTQAAYIVGVSEIIFQTELQDPNSEAHKLYMRGLSETAHKIRSVTREIAEAGSPAAITELMRSMHDCLNEL